MMMHLPVLIPVSVGPVIAWYVWKTHEPKAPPTRAGTLMMILMAVAYCLVSMIGSSLALPISPFFPILAPVFVAGVVFLAVFDR